MSGVYPYPGDDPSALSTFSFSIEAANGFVSVLSKGLAETRSELQPKWTGAASELAQADMAKLTAAFPPMGTKLKAAQTAVDTYRKAIVSIRQQVDQLRTQHAKLAAALQSEQESYARAGRLMEINADPGTSSADIAKQTATMRTSIHGQEVKTQNQLNALDEQYRALVTRSNTAAATCKVALQSASTQYTYQGSTPTVAGVAEEFGLSGLQVAHYQAAVTAGKQAAVLAKDLAHPQPNDPDYQKKLAELLKLTNQYVGDPAFSTKFYSDLGQDDALKLPMELGWCTNGGTVDPEAVGQLQRNLGADLAAATQYYGNAAGNKDGVPQLSDDWVKTLMGSAQHSLAPLSNTNGYDPSFPTFGAQGLGILLHTGQYNAKFLDDSGNAIKQFDGTDIPGDPSVYSGPSATETRFWFGGDGSANDDSGIDPMVGWAQAGIHNPGAEKQALVHDNGLLNYLLNDRKWPNGSAVAGGTDPNALADFKGDFNHGLSLFGTSLDKSVGVGAVDPDSRTLFKNIVTDLGDSSTNHRITDGAFKSTDWIPPELRPAIGDIVVKNIGDVHTSVSQAAGALFDDGDGHGKGLQDLSRVLADVGKDPTARVGINHAENALVSGLLPKNLAQGQNDYDPTNDLNGLGRVNALLQYGGNAHNDATTQAADAAHNGRVDEISSYATYAVETATSKIPIAGDVINTFGVDKISGLITDSLHVDHTQDAYVADANDNTANQANAVNTVNNGVLHSVDPSDLTKFAGKDSHGNPIFPGGTVPSTYNDLSPSQQQALEHYLNAHHNPNWTKLAGTVTDAWETSYANSASQAIDHA